MLTINTWPNTQHIDVIDAYKLFCLVLLFVHWLSSPEVGRLSTISLPFTVIFIHLVFNIFNNIPKPKFSVTRILQVSILI